MSLNTGGRPKGSVNKAGHSAGGSRPGAGRKRIRPDESSDQAAAVGSSSSVGLSSHAISASGKQVL